MKPLWEPLLKAAQFKILLNDIFPEELFNFEQQLENLCSKLSYYILFFSFWQYSVFVAKFLKPNQLEKIINLHCKKIYASYLSHVRSGWCFTDWNLQVGCQVDKVIF